MDCGEKRNLIDPGDSAVSIAKQCQLLRLARSTYYYKSKSTKKEQDKQIMDQIDQVYTQYPFYGVRRITEALQQQGQIINHKRVHRLMRSMGIQAIYPKPNTSKANKSHPVYPYALKDVSIERVNQVWGVDITYIRMRNEFLYLYVILDWHSRYIVEWELSDRLSGDFCCEALTRALSKECPEIHNSDQGSQFTSGDYTDILKAQETIIISMDHQGRCFDNIFTERFWRTIKYEEVYLQAYETPKEARISLKTYIEFYNTTRMHSSLQYQTPQQVYFTRE